MSERTYALLCPKGHTIRATVETLMATCDLQEGSIKPADNKHGFEFEWGGYTEVNYDTEETLERDGERIFMCDEGDEYKEGELRLVVEDEETGDWVAPTKELGIA